MLRPLPFFGTGSLPPAASPKPNSRPISQQIAPNRQSIAARNAPPLRAPRRESRPPGTAQIGERPTRSSHARSASLTRSCAPLRSILRSSRRAKWSAASRPASRTTASAARRRWVEVGRLERIQTRCHQLARPARSTSFAMNNTSSPEMASIMPSPIQSTIFGRRSRPSRQYSASFPGPGTLTRLEQPAACSA